MSQTTFRSLRLHEETLSAVENAGYIEPTEIQSAAIPELLRGRDVLATAQTGTGKTAAFVLPMLQLVEPAQGNRAKAAPHALILSPTRELAAQIHESIGVYGAGGRLSSIPIFGGASKHSQGKELSANPDVMVATPGRLLDFISEGRIDLGHVTYFVLDEADRMLDMGFIPAVRRIVAMLPVKRQTALFSATMPPAIEALASDLLRDPVRVQAEAGELNVEKIDQTVMYVNQTDKLSLLPQLIRDRNMYKVLVFTRTKHRASKVAKILAKQELPADSIHGDKSQNARVRALDAFRSGKIQVLVATDVASRGIDIDDVTHVVNFEIPNEPETYVHRIGRTARAGSEGTAISLCDSTEMPYVRDIEKLMGIRIPVDLDQPFHEERVVASPRNTQRPSARHGQPTGNRGPSGARSGSQRVGARAGNETRDAGPRSGEQRLNVTRQGGQPRAASPASGAGGPQPGRRRRRRR